MLMKVSQSTGSVPSSLFVQGIAVTDHSSPSGMGAYADIFRGSMDGRDLALKRLRRASYENAGDDWRRVSSPTFIYEVFRGLCSSRAQDFFREALLWRQLRHENILEFVGLDEETFQRCICMASPWMINGDLASYISKHESISTTQKLIWVSPISTSFDSLTCPDIIRHRRLVA